MNNHVLGIEINIPGIEVAFIDVQEDSMVSGFVSEKIDSNESPENLVDCWAETIIKCASYNSIDVEKIGIAMPGPFDYDKGVSLITDQKKFTQIYGFNIGDLLAERLNIPRDNIRFGKNTVCLLQGEVLSGSGKGYEKILALTLNNGLGSAWLDNGKLIDAGLWNMPFQQGIAEDYLGIQWITKRYEELSGSRPDSLQDVTRLSKTDDGIGALVFNEYGENFFKFLVQVIGKNPPELLLIGGHSNAWNFFISHVKDRLEDKQIHLPIRPAILGNAAVLIGAAKLWA